MIVYVLTIRKWLQCSDDLKSKCWNISLKNLILDLFPNIFVHFPYITPCLYYTCVIRESNVLRAGNYEYVGILILALGGGCYNKSSSLYIVPVIDFYTFRPLGWSLCVSLVRGLLPWDFLVSIAVMSSRIGLCTSLLHDCHRHIFLFISQTCVWSRGQIG